jgi:hypothetical protein
MDLETGYCLTRPFQQRKNQGSVRGDSGRAEDIAFQIGTSKAIRNVTCNALEFFTSFAADEAKRSIVEKVGEKLDYYKKRVSDRLQEIGIDIKRVEHARGRALKDWLATDVARTIAELQAINDGMATADETYPPLETKQETAEQKAGEAMDKFASGDGDAQSAETKQGTNNAAQDAQQKDPQSETASPRPPRTTRAAPRPRFPQPPAPPTPRRLPIRPILRPTPNTRRTRGSGSTSRSTRRSAARAGRARRRCVTRPESRLRHVASAKV